MTAPRSERQEDQRRLFEHGERRLELLLRAVFYHSSQAVFIADDDRKCVDASFGAGILLGLPRNQIIGRRLDEFAAPGFRPRMERLWRALLRGDRREERLPLVAAGAAAREVDCLVGGHALPMRHLLVVFGEPKGDESEQPGSPAVRAPSWAKDCALVLLDADGRVAAWHAGAERMYGYASEEAIGRHLSFLDCSEDDQSLRRRSDLTRAAAAGRCGSQGWSRRKDGSRLWVNALTSALLDEDERVLGFARAERDFSDRHEADRKERRLSRGGGRQRRTQAAAVGVVSGEFDRVVDADDEFLAMVGYSREELVAGRPPWPNLTPPEYWLLEERAFEEGLIHGACAPYEKEFIRKDGSRVRVRVAGAVLSLSPFRWTAFVQQDGERERQGENGEVDEAPIERIFEEIVGDSAAMRRVFGQIEMVAPTEATVLILGETGTGKELAARAIHRLSSRSGPFVTLNCAAIPTGLLESEMFGYEKGAFTGALARKIGRFELAGQGTLFLDEVGDIPIELQPKLLRALQEKEFERLGGTRTIPIDVRLVAATNRDLTQMMGDKLFRSDLYYRLKVFPIIVPPLRDHPEDIPMLARHFVKKYASMMKRNVETIPPRTMQFLTSWRWPGNVRELENFIERSVILSRGPELRSPVAEISSENSPSEIGGTLEQVEKNYILRVLRETDGVVSKAAARLDIPRTTLNAMMRKLGISRKDI